MDSGNVQKLSGRCRQGDRLRTDAADQGQRVIQLPDEIVINPVGNCARDLHGLR
ncbi:hypothetical protein D3C76_1562210 [compost metagenome]